MPERKNLSSGSNDRSRNLNRFGSLLNFGTFQDRVLQRSDCLRLLDLGRMFINFGGSSDLSLWLGPEEVTDTGGETTANFQSLSFRLYGGCLLNFFSNDGGDLSSNGLTLKNINIRDSD